MKTGKDIFTLFREGGRRLTQKPSPSAWEKLENRLDNRRRSKQLRFQWLPIAAAAAVLFGILVPAFFMLQKMPHKPVFTLENNPKPAVLEVLDTSGGCEPYCLLLKVRKELPAQYSLRKMKPS